jgi:hypothetical protein
LTDFANHQAIEYKISVISLFFKISLKILTLILSLISGLNGVGIFSFIVLRIGLKKANLSFQTDSKTASTCFSGFIGIQVQFNLSLKASSACCLLSISSHFGIAFPQFSVSSTSALYSLGLIQAFVNSLSFCST